MNLQTIENITASCKNCELYKTRNKPVFARGNPKSDIMICGMCPGPDENKEGYPFVEYAPAGSILNEILIRIFGSPDEVYITNLVKCFVSPGKKLTPEWMNSCLPYFIAQLGIIKPKVIIALGKDVSNFLLNNDLEMKYMRGEIYPYMGTDLIVTYHPSYLARGGGLKHRQFDTVVKDFEKAFDILAEKSPICQEMPEEKFYARNNMRMLDKG